MPEFSAQHAQIWSRDDRSMLARDRPNIDPSLGEPRPAQGGISTPERLDIGPKEGQLSGIRFHAIAPSRPFSFAQSQGGFPRRRGYGSGEVWPPRSDGQGEEASHQRLMSPCPLHSHQPRMRAHLARMRLSTQLASRPHLLPTVCGDYGKWGRWPRLGAREGNGPIRRARAGRAGAGRATR